MKEETNTQKTPLLKDKNRRRENYTKNLKPYLKKKIKLCY